MPPPAYLDHRLHLSLGAFTKHQLDAVRSLFVHDNPEYSTWLKYRPTPWAPKKTVGTWNQSGGYLHVPRGRLDEVKFALEQADKSVAWSIDDRRQVGSTHSFKIVGPGMEVRDYQSRLVDHAVDRETCLWRSPAGSGKTSTAFRFIERVGVSTLVVVPNRALLDQWVKRASILFGFKPAVIQGAHKTPGPLTIALQPSLLTCIDSVAGYFGAIICDEVQRFAAKSFNAIIEQCPARYRLGISADEGRADGKEYLLYDQFGPPLEAGIVQRQEMLDQGTIVDVEVCFVPTEFAADWYVNLPPAQKFLHRASLLDALCADEERNALAVRVAQRCLDEGEQVALLSDRREHCARLDAGMAALGCPTGQLLGGEGDREVFEESLRMFARGDYRAVVGTFKAIGVGFETHTRLARGVFCTPVVTMDSAKQQFMQYLGRFARPAAGKQRALVYFLFDPLIHGTKPLRLVRKWVSNVSVLSDSGVHVPISDFLKAPRRHAKKNHDSSDLDPDDAKPRGFYD